MIPKKYTGEMLRGRKARCLVDLVNGGGHGVSAGSMVTITAVVRGHGLTIKTEKCTHCGQYTYISRVPREKLELIENDEHNDGWIPVEERLPEDQKKVLVSDTEGKVRLIEFSRFLFEHPQYTHGVKVIAWRPLPEPYCPGKGDSECKNEEN